MTHDNDTPSNALLEFCQTIPLDETQVSVINTIRWTKGLAERIAAIEPGTIDMPDESGVTALGHLASSFWPGDELVFVLARGVEQLLAAGANPLAGTRPAILQGQVSNEDPRMQKMLSALVSAQRDGTPYRVPGTGGNLLHAMANTDIQHFSRLAEDKFGALRQCGDVVSIWRDEVDAHGKTPVDLAWEKYPSPRRADLAAGAMDFINASEERSVWFRSS